MDNCFNRVVDVTRHVSVITNPMLLDSVGDTAVVKRVLLLTSVVLMMM